MIVTTRHIFSITGYSRRRGFCRSGAREWFDTHGLDWRDFARNGIDESVLTATGDAFALATVQWAHICEQTDAFASTEAMQRAQAAWRVQRLEVTDGR